MNILITICGRAGSKGVKNKNFRNFLGKPLVLYTVAAAKHFKDINNNFNVDICINSDSDKLLELVFFTGGIVRIKRPEELAQDSSAKVPTIKYSVDYMEKEKNKKYDVIIDLDITSPLRKGSDINNALTELLNNDNLDVVFTCVHSRRNPYFNMVEKSNNQIKKVKESNYIRRQEAPEVYDMNASIYCYNRKSLEKIIINSPLEGNCGISLMEDTAVLDIDHEQDFYLMEILGEYYFKKEGFKEIVNYLNR